MELQIKLNLSVSKAKHMIQKEVRLIMHLLLEPLQSIRFDKNPEKNLLNSSNQGNSRWIRSHSYRGAKLDRTCRRNSPDVTFQTYC